MTIHKACDVVARVQPGSLGNSLQYPRRCGKDKHAICAIEWLVIVVVFISNVEASVVSAYYSAVAKYDDNGASVYAGLQAIHVD